MATTTKNSAPRTFHIHHDFMLSLLMHLHNDDVVECFTNEETVQIYASRATTLLSSASVRKYFYDPSVCEPY